MNSHTTALLKKTLSALTLAGAMALPAAHAAPMTDAALVGQVQTAILQDQKLLTSSPP